MCWRTEGIECAGHVAEKEFVHTFLKIQESLFLSKHQVFGSTSLDWADQNSQRAWMGGGKESLYRDGRMSFPP